MVRRFTFALALALLGVRTACGAAQPAGWGNAAIVERDGFPVFHYAGAPFFLYGAAFFYERMPRERWDGALEELHEMGINTLDLYVPWNWHETADGAFDFDGRTNPRRDLDEVLRLARLHDFAIVLRPGPVVRNEWRNGGYPAWLLARPEYGMPLHDLLEGRYPPTATLQNAHSDDAAADWMRNATHLRYARRWLERVLRECAPFADQIVAVALDDDQGAYLDNQTYPAPNLRAYLDWLRDVVQGVTGPRELVFINTYQMKVPASSPVWAMGNWYQSDAFTLGEHDRAQLEFSTALLHTRPDQPLFASEFQAGWLEAPDDVRPRPADPGNTSLALATMFGLGVRGIVNFPAQDTLYPAGWEVPFANSFYAWDAALQLDGAPSPRFGPTAELGHLAATFGPALAASQPLEDAAIAYLGGSFAPAASTNALFSDIAAQTIAAQQACRGAGLTCTLVDPHALGAQGLRRYPFLIVPQPALPGAPELLPDVERALAEFARGGGRILSGVISPATLAAAQRASGRAPAVSGISDARFARVRDARLAGFLTVTNYGDDARAIDGSQLEVAGRPLPIPSFTLPAHRGRIVPVFNIPPVGAVPTPRPPLAAAAPVGLPVRDDALLGVPAFANVAPGTVRAYRSDVFADADSAATGDVVLDNGLVRVVVSPAAGARAFVFEDVASGRNVFTTVGALRDDVALEPPLSTADRIAKYTHQFPAGTFNRPYAATIVADGGARATARFTYDAPDVVPRGARFTRELTLAAGDRAFALDEDFDLVDADADSSANQRAVSVTSLAVGATANMTTQAVLAPDPAAFTADSTRAVARGNALGYYDAADHDLATIAWRAGDVEVATIEEKRFSIVARLTLAPGRRAHLRFGYTREADAQAARSALAAADAAAQDSQGTLPAARTPLARGEVAERSTRSPQKRLSLRSCGFESHLPYHNDLDTP